MASETNHQSLQMLQTGDKFAFLPARTSLPRPLSEATEILDDDFDAELLEYYDGSPRRSIGSLSTESISTASTPDDLPTPHSTGLTSFHFYFDDQPVEGPVGPHLFRSSMDSSDIKSLDADLRLARTPTSATAPLYQSASTLEPERTDTPFPDAQTHPQGTQITSLNQAVSELDESEVRSWTPLDVVRWMQQAGFEDSIVEKFFINDISGSILLELQLDDLKELDIHSFGKRHHLMSSIQHLRNSAMMSSGGSQRSQSNPPTRGPTPVAQPAVGTSRTSDCHSIPTTTDEEKTDSSMKQRQRRRRHRRHDDVEDICPGDSISIVAIEQILPKLHNCSKGEDCRKRQKQKRKLARLAKDLPIESLSGSTILTGDPGNPDTAPNLLNGPKSDATPSIVASSDVLGPAQLQQFRLCEEKLNEVKPRDPQENVRHFLNFQHLSKLHPVNDPVTPPKEHFPSPNTDSPSSVKTSASLAENLRHLPKLRIPSANERPDGSNLSANLSAQRTVTPSVLRKRPPFAQPNATVPGPEQQQNLLQGPDIMSPSDFYRQDSHYQNPYYLNPYGQGPYRHDTPFSEMDVPVTAVPIGPVAREVSQSVPPNMRFGANRHYMADPIARPASTKGENHRRHLPSVSVQAFNTLDPLDEVDTSIPIDTPEDLERTPRAANCQPNPFGPGHCRNWNEITHSGWMKKRKTTRLLRHEWADHHFILKGTQLAMYADEQASQRNSKALEYIDVDDYAVACSSVASSSKLTAAFKKTVLKRKDTANDEAAFAFSLIPAPSNGNASIVDRKAMFMNCGKSHHFAVKTRDERIDWMRDLMLAKALKRGKDSGESVRVNGNVV
ncbi:hypothetical protein VTN02DRAFT_2151 [Thermoascus thermophilus]